MIYTKEVNVQLLNADFKAFKLLNDFAGANAWFGELAIVCADYIIYLMIAGLALFVLHKGKERIHRRAALEALASGFLARGIFVSLIRLWYFRPRPFVAAVVTKLVPQSGLEASFPSAHASIMFALAMSLWLKDKRWGVVYFVLATISGLARVAVGVHYPLDIIGGAIVGVGTAALVRYCAKKRFKV